MFETNDQTMGPLLAGLAFASAPLPPAQSAEPISRWQAGAKRVLDCVLAGMLLVVLALPLLACALWIRRDSPGPVLFRQGRIGRDGRPFVMFKFRTMHHHLAEPWLCRQATRDDPRVTRAGALLRRWSVDELPQLINVLRGEMSLVGPRPHAPGTCAGSRPFEQVTARYAARHCVRPGITGLAQVRGWRGPTETADQLLHRVDADLEYIESWSLLLDLRIMLGTPGAVLRATNAC